MSDESPNPPPSSLRRLLFFVLCFLVVYTLIRPTTGPDGADHRGVGKKLSKQVFQPLTGTDREETSESLAGKIVLINYWGTWCPPCRQEFPHIVAIHDEFKSHEDFRLISVSSTGGTDHDLESLRSSTKEFMDKTEATFNTYADKLRVSRSELAEAAELDSFGFPTTVLLDREGNIAALWRGYTRGLEVEMETVVRHALSRQY